MYIYSILFFRIPLVSSDRNADKMSLGQIWTTGPKGRAPEVRACEPFVFSAPRLSVCLSLRCSTLSLLAYLFACLFVLNKFTLD